MPTHEPLKVAVIGLGRAGYNIHIKRMRDDERYRITAVTDWLPERIQEACEAVGCEGFSDYRALLKDADADVVVVASASDTHPSITREALRSGRHVVCEKPMASSVQAATSMIRAASDSGKKLFMHHNRRFSAEFLHLMDMVNNGRLGNVFEIRMRYLVFFRRFDWQTMRKYGGGQLNNAGSHYLDLGLQLLGAPVKDIYCDLKRVACAGDAEDHVKIIVRAENGRVFDMEISMGCKIPEPKWTLLGTNGTMTCDGSRSHIEWFDPDELAPIELDETPPADRRYDNDDVIPWQSEDMSATAPAIGDFYDNLWAVLRQGARMVVKPEEACEVVRVIQACKRKSGFYD